MSLAKILKTSTLLNKAGAAVEISTLPKTVFLYFSASWCPPCRGFTPVLAEYYNKHKISKDFEVVFLSWDEDESDFKGYYGKMPWLTVDFKHTQSIMEELTKEFNVSSIPTVIVYDNVEGKIISRTARAKIPNDPDAANFPYKD